MDWNGIDKNRVSGVEWSGMNFDAVQCSEKWIKPTSSATAVDICQYN